MNQFLDTINFNPYFFFAAILGIFLSVYCAQLFGRNVFEVSPLAGNMRRLAVLLFGLSCCWSLGYLMEHKNWEVWPPDLLVIIAVDIYLTSILVSAHDKRRVLG